MSPKSNNLFHFTKSLEQLKGILQKGFLPRFCLEDAHQMNLGYLAYPMVCFCDIPISRISEHTAFYGSFGLGMTKEWGLRNSLTPLLYTAPSSPIIELTKYLVNVDVPEDTEALKAIRTSLIDHLFAVISLVKPISGTMSIGGTIVEKQFYQENEWRYVPNGETFIDEKDFLTQRDAENTRVERKGLKFTPSDIRYIFVKSDADIPIVFDYLHNNLGHYSLNDIKILSSRITSLETLATDV